MQIPDQLGKIIDAEGSKGYCCEGVAVERYGARLGYAVEWDEAGELRLNGSIEYAPNYFWHALGLVGKTTDPATSAFTFNLPDGLTSLTGQSEFTYMSLNDEGLTFGQIADLIEWQFLPCPAA